MSERSEKIREAIRINAAEFLMRESNRQSLITVTGAAVSDNLKRAMVFITVLPDSHETAALGLANRKVRDFREFLRERVKLGVLPRIEFVIDRGEKNRQRLDELSDN
ncbi:MAG TPA: ribosome-binding factor A [Candidatus Paceibacterota bacterium]